MKPVTLRLCFLAFVAAVMLPLVSGCGSDPMSSQITLTTSKSSIPADGNTTAEITATILGYDGHPVPIGTSVHFTTSRGLFTNGLSYVTVGTTDSTGSVKVYLFAPLRTTPGTANVTCTSNNVTRSVNVEITLYGPPGETAKIELTADPTTIPADGATPSKITATLTDGNEDPVNIGTEATFTTDKGEFQNGSTVFTDVTRDTSGTIIAYLIAPEDTEPGAADIRCTSNGVTARVTVIIGGEGVSLTITACTSVPADGQTICTVTATVAIEGGPPMAGIPVTFRARVGEFSNGELSITDETDNGGVATASWVVQEGTKPGVYPITASALGQRATVSVTVTEP